MEFWNRIYYNCIAWHHLNAQTKIFTISGMVEIYLKIMTAIDIKSLLIDKINLLIQVKFCSYFWNLLWLKTSRKKCQPQEPPHKNPTILIHVKVLYNVDVVNKIKIDFCLKFLICDKIFKWISDQIEYLDCHFLWFLTILVYVWNN